MFGGHRTLLGKEKKKKTTNNNKKKTDKEKADVN